MEEYSYYYIPGEGSIRVVELDGKVAEHAILTGPKVSQFAGYRMIAKDVNLLQQCLNELATTPYPPQHIIPQSLSFTFIVTYGKCFALAEGRKVKLDHKTALANCTELEKQLHSELIEIRNRYVAHGGESKFERNPVVLAIHELDPERTLNVYDNPVFMSALDTRPPMYKSLIAKIETYVQRKVKESREVMMKELEKSFDIDSFKQHAFVPKREDLKPLQTIQL